MGSGPSVTQSFMHLACGEHLQAPRQTCSLEMGSEHKEQGSALLSLGHSGEGSTGLARFMLCGGGREINSLSLSNVTDVC